MQDALIVHGNEAVVPDRDATMNLGSPAYRWRETHVVKANVALLAVRQHDEDILVVNADGEVLVRGSDVITKHELFGYAASTLGTVLYLFVLWLSFQHGMRRLRERRYAAEQAAKRGPDGGPYRNDDNDTTTCC